MSKTGAYSGEGLFRLSILGYAAGLICKHMIRVEKLARDKQ